MGNGDSDIPRFPLYGEGTPAFADSIQPALDLRSWSDLQKEERSTAFQQIFNSGWMEASPQVLGAIEHLNYEYLRLCPRKNLHKIPKKDDRYGHFDFERKNAARKEFYRIFLEEPEPLVLRMLSKFAQLLISPYELKQAKKAADSYERAKYVEEAFKKFDSFATCLNHVFEQFAVNQLMTRNGFMPRQDETIDQELCKPTLKALSDPKWRRVNEILVLMFEDFREGRFPETITKAHSAIHRFLQILVGEPGSNAKGELGKLMKDGKNAGFRQIDSLNHSCQIFRASSPQSGLITARRSHR